MADILIRGMEMPTGCVSCHFADFRPDSPVQYCKWLMKPFVRMTERLKDCPLVELPPHGDLISLEDALIDADERAYDFWTSDDEANGTKQF